MFFPQDKSAEWPCEFIWVLDRFNLKILEVFQDFYSKNLPLFSSKPDKNWIELSENLFLLDWCSDIQLSKGKSNRKLRIVLLIVIPIINYDFLFGLSIWVELCVRTYLTSTYFEFIFCNWHHVINDNGLYLDLLTMISIEHRRH